jgi:hypothetical protein
MAGDRTFETKDLSPNTANDAIRTCPRKADVPSVLTMSGVETFSASFRPGTEECPVGVHIANIPQSRWAA